MEYDKKKTEACCGSEYPKGYYEMGMNEDDYKKMMMKRKKKMEDYHDMDGYKMKGKKHMGPEGYWGIPGMHSY